MVENKAKNIIFTVDDNIPPPANPQPNEQQIIKNSYTENWKAFGIT